MLVPALLILNVSTMLKVTFVNVMPDTTAMDFSVVAMISMNAPMNQTSVIMSATVSIRRF